MFSMLSAIFQKEFIGWLFKNILPGIFSSGFDWWKKKEEHGEVNQCIDERMHPKDNASEDGSFKPKKLFKPEEQDVVTVTRLLMEKHITSTVTPLVDDNGKSALLAFGKVGYTKEMYFLDLQNLILPFAVQVKNGGYSPFELWQAPGREKAEKVKFSITYDKEQKKVYFFAYNEKGEKVVERYYIVDTRIPQPSMLETVMEVDAYRKKMTHRKQS